MLRVLFTLVFLGWVGSVHAILIEIGNYNSIGGFVETAPYDGNFDNGTLKNDSTVASFSIVASDHWWSRVGLQFELPEIQNIDSASLILPFSSAYNSPTIEVNGYSGDGVVTRTDVVIDNLIGTFELPNLSNPPIHYVYLDVTNFIQDLLVDLNNEYAGFNLRIENDLFATNTHDAYLWTGRIDHFLDGNIIGPILDIQTIPEPPAIALMGLGLLGLFGFSRRRKH